MGPALIFYTTDGTTPSQASPTYSGPIPIVGGETIQAVAYYPGVCADSIVAVYSGEPCDPSPLYFNPVGSTQNNDFLVLLTWAPQSTICFTFGAGSSPTCNVSATSAMCSGTSQTYNADAGLGVPGSVTINGTVTNAQGQVTVNAIACAPGLETQVASQVYTLQAALPKMDDPPPSLMLASTGVPYTPTVSSVTSEATLRYTTDGSTPTCETGAAAVGNPAMLTVTQSTTFGVIACKIGYAPSPLAAFFYGIATAMP